MMRQAGLRDSQLGAEAHMIEEGKQPELLEALALKGAKPKV